MRGEMQSFWLISVGIVVGSVVTFGCLRWQRARRRADTLRQCAAIREKAERLLEDVRAEQAAKGPTVSVSVAVICKALRILDVTARRLTELAEDFPYRLEVKRAEKALRYAARQLKFDIRKEG